MTTKSIDDLSLQSTNGLTPLIPSICWPITEADKGNKNMPTFNWIQAFWDATTYTAPAILAVWSGDYAADGSMIVSPIQFAFPGERVVFKGKVILASGKDRFGNTVTSTEIGSDLSAVYGYGGNS